MLTPATRGEVYPVNCLGSPTPPPHRPLINLSTFMPRASAGRPCGFAGKSDELISCGAVGNRDKAWKVFRMKGQSDNPFRMIAE